jgi:hypothetical protein
VLLVEVRASALEGPCRLDLVDRNLGQFDFQDDAFAEPLALAGA